MNPREVQISNSTHHDYRGRVISKLPVDQIEPRPVKQSPEEGIPFSGPMLVPPSDFAWARRPRDGSGAWMRSTSGASSRGLDYASLFHTGPLRTESSVEQKRSAVREVPPKVPTSSRRHEGKKMVKGAPVQQWANSERPGSFDSSGTLRSLDPSRALHQRQSRLVLARCPYLLQTFSSSHWH